MRQRILALRGLAALASCLTLACLSEHESALRDIRLNQLGFQPSGAKRAILRSDAGAPLPWQLRDASGQVRAQGESRVFGENPGSGEHIHIIELGAFEAPGAGYTLRIGGQSSRPFPIAQDIYSSLKRDALLYFYHSRSGTPIDAARVRDAQWARPAGHAPDRAGCFSGQDLQGNEWRGCGYTLDVTGGWYDAGDQGKYVVSGAIAVWTLLNYWERVNILQGAELARKGSRSAGREHDEPLNDLLEEARWQLRFLLAMQVPEHTTLHLPIGDQRRNASKLEFTAVDASDMVHHKVHDARWTRLPTAPHEDHEARYLYPPSTAATLDLAAVAAQCARIWRTRDPEFSGRCLRAAQRAFAAAERHPDIYAIGPVEGGGAYSDYDVRDEFYWAAAELFVTTGQSKYDRAMRASPYFLAAPSADESGRGDLSWSHVAALGTISLALVPNSAPVADIARARARLIARAEDYCAQADHEGYVIPYAVADYPWGSNASILNRALILALAADFTGRTRFRDRVVDAMDYLLGRNPLDQSYVSGYGVRPMRNPHHRFWARQLNATYPPPPPGVLSGGPNSSSMRDPIAIGMRGSCRAQTCWKDDIRAFTQNEVAINWNAPLFWVAAFLDELK